MKVLVCVKRVLDPQVKARVKAHVEIIHRNGNALFRLGRVRGASTQRCRAAQRQEATSI